MPKYQPRSPLPSSTPPSSTKDLADHVKHLQQKLQNLLQQNPALVKKAAAIIEDLLHQTPPASPKR